MTDAKYVFLDVETTGLDPYVDEGTEGGLVYEDARDEGVSQLFEEQWFVEHRRLPDEYILKHMDYVQRIMLGAPKIPLSATVIRLNHAFMQSSAYANEDPELDPKWQGKYLVAATPQFAAGLLRAIYHHCGLTKVPWDYHLIDVQAMAMGVLGLPKPPRLKEMRLLLGIPGQNPAPHSALSDAKEVKICFEKMM